MHSPSDTLVRMANQIGKFFAARARSAAIAGIADHIKKFWEPRMKKQIFAHLDEGGAGLDPLTLAALQKLKADMHGKSTAAEAKAAAEAAAAQSAPVPATKKVAQPAQQAKAKAGKAGKAPLSRLPLTLIASFLADDDVVIMRPRQAPSAMETLTMFPDYVPSFRLRSSAVPSVLAATPELWPPSAISS